jgi:erythromycin esterase
VRAKTALWVLVTANCLGLSSLALAASASPSPDELQKWIAERAVTVRTIDAADENFSDLEPLIDAIGTARVVQLGEPSHGAGSSFAAKVRLIKFLHQRMGFDVVAWESGLYDVHLAQAGMRAGDDAVAAALTGIFAIWSATEEVRPLFEYAKVSQATGRPLDMAGFDMQISAEKFTDRFAADLRSFVGVLRDQTLRDRASGLVEQALAAHRRLFARNDARRRIEADSVRAAQAGEAPRQSMADAMAA